MRLCVLDSVCELGFFTFLFFFQPMLMNNRERMKESHLPCAIGLLRTNLTIVHCGRQESSINIHAHTITSNKHDNSTGMECISTVNVRLLFSATLNYPTFTVYRICRRLFNRSIYVTIHRHRLRNMHHFTSFSTFSLFFFFCFFNIFFLFFFFFFLFPFFPLASTKALAVCSVHSLQFPS